MIFVDSEQARHDPRTRMRYHDFLLRLDAGPGDLW
jgi:hypothetical protein